MNLKTLSLFVIPAALLIGSAPALAQDEVEYEPEEAEAEVYVEAPEQQYALQPSAPAGSRVDGMRFRGAAALSVGGERVGNADFKATLIGFDARLGLQVNDLLGIYAMPHVSFGPAKERGISGFTGTVAMMVMADITLFDALFFGAGFGYGVMNNPSGPALGFRVGGYPLKSVDEYKARRRGLALAFDMRTYFLGGFYGTGIQYMFSVGYEAF
jgi:hypothetical protein